MRATIPIGISPGTKVLRIERSKNTQPYWLDEDGYWIIWLHANQNFTLGTYLLLKDDGSMENHTIHEDGTETIFTVKEADK